MNDAVAIYEQEADGERRYLYYGESSAGRLLGIAITISTQARSVITTKEDGNDEDISGNSTFQIRG